MTCCNFRGLHAVGSALDLNCLIGGVFASCMLRFDGDADTMKTGFGTLRWRLRWLWKGHPDKDASGNAYPPDSPEPRKALEPLAGGFFGVLWVTRGDLEYYALSLGLPHFGSGRPCGECRRAADNSEYPWNVFSTTEPLGWIHTARGHVEWCLARPARNMSFTSPGVSVLTVRVDILPIYRTMNTAPTLTPAGIAIKGPTVVLGLQEEPET
jgi:hypothetical protein